MRGGRSLLGILVNPVGLILGIILSVILWMPFGMGYYGWHWESLDWRVVLYVFVFGFPLIAAISVIMSCTGNISLFRLAVSLFALVIGLFGVFAMFSWIAKYVNP